MIIHCSASKLVLLWCVYMRESGEEGRKEREGTGRQALFMPEFVVIHKYIVSVVAMTKDCIESRMATR